MGRGRSRDARLDAELMAAAGAVLAADGFDRFRVEAVAEAAGVPKSTIYRRWPSRSALLLAFLMDWFTTHAMIEPGGGPIRDELTFLVAQEMEMMATPQGRAVARVAISALDNPGDDVAPLTDLISARRLRYEMLIDRASRDREMPSNTDPKGSLDMLIGAAWSAAVTRTETAPSFAEDVVDALLSSPPVRRAERPV